MLCKSPASNSRGRAGEKLYGQPCLARPQAPLTATAGGGGKPASSASSGRLSSFGQKSGSGQAPFPGSCRAACSSSRVLVTSCCCCCCCAVGTASSCNLVSNAAAAAAAAPLRAPPVPSFPSPSPSSFYSLPPPLFPSSSSFSLPSPRGGEGGEEAIRVSGRDVGAAAATTAAAEAASLILYPGGGRRRLFLPPSLQDLLLPLSSSEGATGQRRRRHREQQQQQLLQRVPPGPRLLCPALSGLWSYDLLGGGGAARGDGPGGRSWASRQQQARGTFFTFSSFPPPLLLGPDMEDGSSSASCFRRFTECFLSTSRWLSSTLLTCLRGKGDGLGGWMQES